MTRTADFSYSKIPRVNFALRRRSKVRLRQKMTDTTRMPAQRCGAPGCFKPRFHVGLHQAEEEWARINTCGVAMKLELNRRQRLKDGASRRPARSPARSLEAPAPAPAPEPEQEAEDDAEVPTPNVKMAPTFSAAATVAAEKYEAAERKMARLKTVFVLLSVWAVAATATAAAAALSVPLPTDHVVRGATASLRALVLLSV